KKNYVAFRLKGTRSNRDAIGAVVRVYQGEKVLTRQVLGICGYLAQSSHTLHFGLGDRPEIDRVEITWPSGARHRLDAVTANTPATTPPSRRHPQATKPLPPPTTRGPTQNTRLHTSAPLARKTRRPRPDPRRHGEPVS